MNYFDKKASAYQMRSERGIWKKWRQQERLAVFELLQMFPDCRLFEVGSGAGYYLRALSDLGFKKISGCDRSEAMARVCREDGLVVDAGDYSQMNLSADTNRILAAGVLEFVPNISSFFIWAKKNTKEGALLVLLIPQMNWRGKLYQIFHQANGNKVYLRSLAEIKKLAQAAGWEFIRKLPGSPISVGLCFRRREN
jgi:cyclopropane fatty-acyl-phospholipid synthase-like methyltransferase